MDNDRKNIHPRLLTPYIFCLNSVIALLALMIYPTSENYSIILFESIGIGLFIQFVPWIFQYYSNEKGYGQLTSWYHSSSFFLLCGFGVVFLVAQIADFGINLGWLLSILGWLLYFNALVKLLKEFNFLPIIIFFTILGIFLFLLSSFKLPIFEQMLRNGINEDALFHSAIANMINTYGIPSTGFNGIPFMHYHIGSHWAITQFTKILNIPVLLTYRIIFDFVILPLVFSAMFYLILDYKEFIYNTLKKWNIIRDWKFWILFIVLFFPLNYYSVINGLPFLTRHFGSESWAFSIGLSAILLSLTLSFFKENNSFNKVCFTKTSTLIFCCLIFPVLLSLIGFLKISVIFILFLLTLYAFIRLSLYKYLIFNISLFLTFLIFVFTFLVVKQTTIGAISLTPFFQWMYWASPEIRPYFLQIYCLWAWIYFYVRLRQQNIKSLGELKVAFGTKKTFDLECLFFLCVICLLPGNLIRIEGGSYVYFSDYQVVLSCCFLLGVLPMFIENSAPEKKYKLTDISINCCLIILFILPLVVNLVINMKDKLHIARMEAKLIDTKFTLSQKQKLTIMDRAKIVNSDIFQSENYKLIKLIDKLNEIPIGEKRETLVFVKPNEKLKKLTQLGHCEFASFLVPALTGLALVEGLPTAECLDAIPSGGKSVLINSYLSSYSEKEYNTPLKSLLQLTSAQLCNEVIEKGFSKLIILDVSKPVNPIEKYNCNKNTALS